MCTKLVNYWDYTEMHGQQNTIKYPVTFFLKSCRLWDDDTAGQATDDNIIWSMRFECSITKATHTHTHTQRERERERENMYHLLFYTTATIVTRTRLYVTSYVQCLSSLTWSMRSTALLSILLQAFCKEVDFGFLARATNCTFLPHRSTFNQISKNAVVHLLFHLTLDEENTA